MAVAIRASTPDDDEALVALWQACGLTRPWNDPRKDIARKRAVDAGLLAVAERDGVLIGSVMAGYEGHRGWINYLAVAPAARGQGVGRALMAWAEDRLRERGCPKINLQVRRDNAEVIAFYEAIGFAVEPIASLGKRLVRD